MAVAIDTANMVEHYIHRLQRFLDCTAGSVRRYQVHRVCAHATVVFDDSETLWRALQNEKSRVSMVANHDALGWQHDPDDDVHELEVLHHLQQLSPAALWFSNQKGHTDDATTLVASAVSPSFSTMTHGRLPSSFHRNSLRLSLVRNPLNFSQIRHWVEENVISGFRRFSAGQDDLANPWNDSFGGRFSPPHLKIVWDSSKGGERYVFWQAQVDVVDLWSPRAHPGKRRRRSAFNPFQQVSDSPAVEAPSRGNHLPQTKRFNGVRHRPDRKTWVAEMKPPKHRNKQDFGNFKSEAQAARAVDAAFHHYGKPHRLNFPDTSPNILSTRPPEAAGLDDTAKLRFVKQEAKWLATMAANSPLPSARPHSLPSQSPEPSTSCTAVPDQSSRLFRSFSEISSPLGCAGPDEGVSQPQPVMDLPPFPDMATVAGQSMEPSSGGSFVEIAELAWDVAEEREILAALPNVVSPRACESLQSMWLDSLIRSPPAPVYPMTPSPSHCEDDLVYALLEQQRSSVGDDLI